MGLRSKHFRWLALLCSVGLVPPPAAAQSREDLFRQAFGNRQTAPRQLELELEVDGTARDSVPVTVAGQTLREVATTVLAERLADLLDPDAAACLAQLGADRQRVEDVAGCGFALSYRPAELRLVVSVPTALRREQALSVRAPRTEPAASTAAERLSAYLNFAGTLRHTQRGQSGATRQALAVDGAVHWGQSTFEFDGWCAEQGCVSGLRSWVHDDPEALRRWRLGDLPDAAADGLGLPGLRGVSVGTAFELQPLRTYTPDLDAALELAGPTTLEVLVNGLVVQRLQLPAGRYEVRDFPLLSGRNDAELRLTDAAGRQEIRTLEAYVDLALLDAGRWRYGLLAAQPRLPVASPGAAQHPLVLAGEYALGLSPRATVSAGAVWVDAPGRSAASVGLTHAVGEWLLGGQMACSFGRFRGCHAELKFRRSAPGGAGSTAVWQQEGALGWRQPGYAELFGEPLGAGGEWLWRATRGLGERYQLALGARGQWTASHRSRSTLSALLGGRIGRQGSLRIGLEQGLGGTGRGSTRAVLNFTWLFDQARQSLQWQLESPDAQQTARWQLNRAGLRGGFNAGLAASYGGGVDSVEAAASYRHERFSSAWAYSRFAPADAVASTETRWTVRSALACVGGQCALGERVLGGFAIVKPTDPAAAGTVYVNPVDADYLASSRGPGPALVTGLRAHEPRALVLALPELAPEHDPGELFPVVRPGYKGGVLVPTGGAPLVRLAVRLLDGSGAPLGMTSGRLEGAGRPPIPVFAGRTGALRASGLTPGRWLLVLDTRPVRRHEFEVADGHVGLLDLGDLRP